MKSNSSSEASPVEIEYLVTGSLKIDDPAHLDHVQGLVDKRASAEIYWQPRPTIKEAQDQWESAYRDRVGNSMLTQIWIISNGKVLWGIEKEGPP